MKILKTVAFFGIYFVNFETHCPRSENDTLSRTKY
jgi:hypothetical protein